MGVVYEALDRDHGTRVALKTLRRVDAQALLRFKNEFRALQDLEHPNLVSLGELIEKDGQWFFTMELIEGVDFVTYVQLGAFTAPRSDLAAATPGASAVELDPASAATADLLTITSPPLDREVGGGGFLRRTKSVEFDEVRLRTALAQLVQGLLALHGADKVHRDVKPSNVYVDTSGRVVLLDFGLITEALAADQSSAGHAVGTAPYMSPEQAASKPVGPESDWYSVGVVLYQSMTGQLPFMGSPVQICMDKQQREPPGPATWNPDIPRELDRLCSRLLSFDPEARPTGEELLHFLGVVATAPSSSSSRLTQSGHFVGREAELAELGEAFAATRAGATATVYVHGESGVGKSALLRRFAKTAAIEAQAVVLSGRCYEREAVPYKAFDGVVDALSTYMSGLPADEAAALLPRSAALLLRIFPVLGRVAAIADAPRPLREVKDPHELRNRVFAALRELFYRLAERRPVIIVIDDLQWAGAESLLLLGDLMRPPDAPPLLLLISSRRASVSVDLDGRDIAVEVDLPGDVRELALQALEPEPARQLARHLLARVEVAREHSPALLAVEAKGHPLYIAELVRHVVIAGSAKRDRLRLDEVIWLRASHLPELTRRLLEIVVVAGTPLPQDIVREAANMPPGDFNKQVALLRVANLARSEGGRGVDPIEPYHDRVREGILVHLDDDTRRDHSRRLAVVLESVGAGATQPELLLRYFEAAGESEKAAGYAAAAAQRALQALAFDRAAELYQTTIALGDHDRAELRSLRIALADALANAGRGAEAAEVYLDAAEDADATTRRDCQRRAALQLLATGRIERGVDTLRAVLRDVGTELPTPRRGLMSLLWQRAKLRVRGLGWRERHENEIARSELARQDIYQVVADGIGPVDPIRGADFQARSLLLALRLGERSRVVRAICMEGCFSAANGGRALAHGRELVESMIDVASGDAYLEAFVIFTRGVIDFLSANYRAGAAHLRESESRFMALPVPSTIEINTGRSFYVGSLRELGELRQWQSVFGQYLRDAARRGDLYAETTLRRIGTFLALVADRPAAAHADLERTSWMPPEKGYHMQHWFELQARVELALYEEATAALCDELSAGLEAARKSLVGRIALVRINLWALWGRLVLAASATAAQREARLAFAKRCVRRLDKERSDYARVAAGLLRAGLAVQRGASDEAIDYLAATGALAEKRELKLHVEVARRRRGQLLGGDEGGALIAAADSWMASEGVVAPSRLVGVIAPGFTAS